jgi:hypothetical protein
VEARVDSPIFESRYGDIASILIFAVWAATSVYGAARKVASITIKQRVANRFTIIIPPFSVGIIPSFQLFEKAGTKQEWNMQISCHVFATVSAQNVRVFLSIFPNLQKHSQF